MSWCVDDSLKVFQLALQRPWQELGREELGREEQVRKDEGGRATEDFWERKEESKMEADMKDRGFKQPQVVMIS